MINKNIFVFIKTSFEDEDERRRHQDECLLGSFVINYPRNQSDDGLENRNVFLGISKAFHKVWYED